ncbi:MAG: HAD-IB family hydrolase [Actinobacteria bacterium]|nr:HAD-IB family hydrolase [Actinomycetota bacterium]
MPEPESKPKIEAAFFDVDNTLVRGSTSILFGKVAFTGGTIKRRDIWRFMFEQSMFIRRGENNEKMADFKDRALSLTKGHSVDELRDLIDVVYRQEIKPRLWPETVAAAKEHLAAGREVWLLTAAPVELAQAIAKDIGATGALGTIVGHKDGVLTGELIGEPLHGKAKRRAAKALAKERGISLKRSWAYSDSANDLPLLSLVGHAVAVNPDKVLCRYAEAAGWQVLKFKKRDLRKRS